MEAYRSSVRHETISASIDTPEERQKIKQQINQLNRYILTLQANCIRPGTNPVIFSQALEFFQLSHYMDVIQERLIQGTCSFPLCRHTLSSSSSSRLVPSTKELMYRNKVAKEAHRDVYDMEKIESYCSRLCMVTSLSISKQISEVLPYSRLFDGRNYSIPIPTVWPPPTTIIETNDTTVPASANTTTLPIPSSSIVTIPNTETVPSTSLHTSSLPSTEASTLETFSSVPSSTVTPPTATTTAFSLSTHTSSVRSSSVQYTDSLDTSNITSSQALLDQQLRNIGINPSTDTTIEKLQIKERTVVGNNNDPSSLSSTATVNNNPHAIEGFSTVAKDNALPVSFPTSSQTRSRFAKRTTKLSASSPSTTPSSVTTERTSTDPALSTTSTSKLDAYLVQEDTLIDLQSARSARASKYKRTHNNAEDSSHQRSRTNSSTSLSTVSAKGTTGITGDNVKHVTGNDKSTNTKGLSQGILSLSTNRNHPSNRGISYRDDEFMNDDDEQNPLVDNEFSALFLAPVPELQEWNKSFNHDTHVSSTDHTNIGTGSRASSELYLKQNEDKVTMVSSTVPSSSVSSSSTTETKSILKTSSSSSSSSVSKPIKKVTVADTVSVSNDMSSNTMIYPSPVADNTNIVTKKQVHFDNDPLLSSSSTLVATESTVIATKDTENNNDDDGTESDEDIWWKRYVGDEDDGDDDDGFIDDEETEGTFGGIWDHTSIRLPYEDATGRSTGYDSTMKAVREERGEVKSMEMVDETKNHIDLTLANDLSVSNAYAPSPSTRLPPVSPHKVSTNGGLTIPKVNKSDILGFGSIEAIGLGYSEDDDDDKDHNRNDGDDDDGEEDKNGKKHDKTHFSSNGLSQGIGKDGLEHPISVSVSNQRAFGVSSYGILWSALSAWRTKATVDFLSGTGKIPTHSSKDLLDLRNYISGETRTSLPAESDTSIDIQEKTFNAALAVAIARRDLLLSYIGRAVKWITTTATSVPSSSFSSSSLTIDASSPTVVIDPIFVQYIQSSACEERLPVFLSTWSMRNPVPLLAEHEWRILAMVILFILYSTRQYSLPVGITGTANISDESKNDENNTMHGTSNPVVTVPAPEDTENTQTLTAAQELYSHTLENKTVILCTDTLIRTFRAAVTRADEAKKLKKKNTKITTKDTQPPPGSILTVQQIANLGHLLAFGPDVPTPSVNDTNRTIPNPSSISISTGVTTVPKPNEIIRGNGTTPGETTLTPQERLIRAELEMLEAYRQLGKN